MMQRDEDKLQAALWELICMRKKRPGYWPGRSTTIPGVLVTVPATSDWAGAGIPDLHFLVNGRYQTLEVKTEKGRQEPARTGWIEALNARGTLPRLATAGMSVWTMLDA